MALIEKYIAAGNRVEFRANAVDDIAQVTFGDPDGEFQYARPPPGQLVDLSPHLPPGRTEVHLQVVNHRGPWRADFELFIDGVPMEGSPFRASGDDWLLQRVHRVAHIAFIVER